MTNLLFVLLAASANLTFPQKHVLPVFGCGTGCRVETEQLSLSTSRDSGVVEGICRVSEPPTRLVDSDA